MIRLVRAEFRRLLARRLFRIIALLAAIGLAGGGVLAFATSHSLSETTYQQRVKEAEAKRIAQRNNVEACLRQHGYDENSSDRVPESIAQACFPKQPITAHDPRFHRTRLKGILQGLSGVLCIVGWVIGASFVGAEFASRSMTTLLTWEARRGRVFLAKLIAVTTTVAAFAAIVLLVAMAVMLPSMVMHGGPLRPTEPHWPGLFGILGRGTLLAALGAGIGFAIATIGRNTAAALGAGFAYILILENILGSSLVRWRRWLLLGNVIVLVSGKASSDVPGRSVTGAGLFLAAVTATFAIAAASAFRVRDIA